MEFYNITDKVPQEEQDVIYIFHGRAYLGKYERCTEEYGTHIFYGSHGFLTDDVVYWYPVII